ncbi:ubiquitin carboxyl-terminal hydrolase 5-like [Tropilaelaps mercedesae]|uniref:Ubiquitin carboxyl-terminal hydrolase n=1 Tax=Tropilaelaps mercedesae TaxID=418985 RepID=A0A1V9XZU2_9ACAR|nr:ubiquitin carboxyl-terminal hydrolase 5-like [Tropilaelaps mercedesae]
MSVSYETLAQLQVRYPAATDRVYKDECAYSFTTPESEDGLYVSLFSFLGFAKQHALDYAAKTGYKVFLHIKRSKLKVEAKEAAVPTRLAIGLEGGFQDTNKFEYEEQAQIVVLPECTVFNLDDPKLPENVMKSAESVHKAESAFRTEELSATTGTWDGEARMVSKHSETLVQLSNGVRIPASGWKCARCELRENLWLNLTDGAINCGRRFFDGSGGNDHAVKHYNETKYPLAVKLGTINYNGADVYSYDEDDMVIDSQLEKHLRHFGIDVAAMQKTEKSMAELELDMNQRIDEWIAATEEGCRLEPLYGPGYTGLVNLGNSCYMNSIVQMLFVIPAFVRRYYDAYGTIIAGCSQDPNTDLRVQMAKLAYGILSGAYSNKPANDIESPAIRPQSFKYVVGRNHPEFSSKRQQDAEEYFCHLMELLDRDDKDNPISNVFSFNVEERIECGRTGKVAYKKRRDVVLRLVIPMESATNRDEVEAYEARKRSAEARKERLDSKELVLAKIPFDACLAAFAAVSDIDGFFSSAADARVTVKQTIRFLTFPDYLLVQAKRFTFAENWSPKKLDISLQVPDQLDLTHLRAKGGLQPGEEAMPSNKTAKPLIDEATVAQLTEMGFPREGCRRAVYHTKNSGVEVAMQWVMEHMSDTDFGSPFILPGSERDDGPQPPDESIQMVMGMGFSRQHAIRALRATQNCVERAIDWIFSHQDELNAPEPAPADVAAGQGDPRERLITDGSGRYRLVAFVTHMGSNTSSGHYVCHLLKDGEWVICNDDKIARSEKPPKDLAYLYLYKRAD